MQDYQEVIRNEILNHADLVRVTFSGQQRGQDLKWRKLVIRPVIIRDSRHLQFSYFDERKSYDHNYTDADLPAAIDEILALPFRNFVILTRDETIQINLSKKGKPFISRKKNAEPLEPDLDHNRQKQVILQEGADIAFLRVLGLTNEVNQVRHKQRDKFKQIQSFLQVLSDIDEIANLPDNVRVVDFGCGSAYLTMATYFYLNTVLGKKPHIIGVDFNDTLQQQNQAQAHELGWDGLAFVSSTIADYKASHPADMVLALHACDTASDDALVQAIHWKSAVVLVAPCCHHNLQVKLKEQTAPDAFKPVLRYGLLHERMGDIITDTFRTQILKVLGYQVDLLQFVAPDHTPKNLLIRALYTGHTHDLHQQEYQELLDYWRVEPYLHEQLATELGQLLTEEPHAKR